MQPITVKQKFIRRFEQKQPFKHEEAEKKKPMLSRELLTGVGCNYIFIEQIIGRLKCAHLLSYFSSFCRYSDLLNQISETLRRTVLI